MSAPTRPASGTTDGPGVRAEAIRLELADAWGEMGASWGVAPAIARVHAYLMARGEPLTEREVREALGLSHRAASLALDSAVRWGVVEKVPEPRRVGRRGPAGTAYLAVGDHFRWFSRVIAHRKALEGDPIIAVLERTLREAEAAAAAAPDDAELRALREWLGSFLGFVRLFDRAIGLVPVVAPDELERLLGLLARLPTRRPASRSAPRRAPRRRGGLARRRPQPAVPDRGATGDEADVGRDPDRRPVGRAAGRPGRSRASFALARGPLSRPASPAARHRATRARAESGLLADLDARCMRAPCTVGRDKGPTKARPAISERGGASPALGIERPEAPGTPAGRRQRR